MGNEADPTQCERCGTVIAPGRTRCLAHAKGSASLSLLGLSLQKGRRGPSIAAAGESESTLPHHRSLEPAVLLVLARAASNDFEACVTFGEVVFDPGPVPRLRWRRRVGLEWLNARGFLEGRVRGSRFPVAAFVPRLLPPVSRPELQPRFIRRMVERAATRQADCEAFFGELWPAVQAVLRE